MQNFFTIIKARISQAEAHEEEFDGKHYYDDEEKQLVVECVLFSPPRRKVNTDPKLNALSFPPASRPPRPPSVPPSATRSTPQRPLPSCPT